MILDVRKLRRAARPFVLLGGLTLTLVYWGGLRLWDALTTSAAVLGVRREREAAEVR